LKYIFISITTSQWVLRGVYLTCVPVIIAAFALNATYRIEMA